MTDSFSRKRTDNYVEHPLYTAEVVRIAALGDAKALAGKTILVTGGGAMLYGLDELIRRETDIPTALAEEAMSCVAIGCGKALDSFSKFDGKARNVKTGR